jgi:hypothetical protein
MTCSHQGGWVGLVVILVALVIVAFLAKDALKKYGLVPSASTATKAGTPGERARAAGAVGIDATDLDQSAPQAPGAALDRARGVEEMVQRQADERAQRMDGVK